MQIDALKIGQFMQVELFFSWQNTMPRQMASWTSKTENQDQFQVAAKQVWEYSYILLLLLYDPIFQYTA